MSLSVSLPVSVPQGLSPKQWVRSAEDWWFDTTRRVETVSGALEKPDLTQIVGDQQDSYVYLPIRATNARQAIRDLPIRHFPEYTFIDMGSGKGKMLFVAAEYPFRRVIGVEYSKKLHDQAVVNCSRYRHPTQKCPVIEPIFGNAAEYKFPDDQLVVYLFNPFGPEVMGQMLRNLESSMEHTPRHVVILMIWPEHSQVVAGLHSMQEYKKTRRHHVFQSMIH
jgi:hypothetical protein